MKKINEELFNEVREFSEKYQQLEDHSRAMVETFNSQLMDSQSKWFQITK